jgi:hypothetical protein
MNCSATAIIQGRDSERPVLLDTDKAMAHYPLGVDGLSMRNAFIATIYVISGAVLTAALFLICCCWSRLTTRCKGSSAYKMVDRELGYTPYEASSSYVAPRRSVTIDPNLSKALEAVSQGVATALLGMLEKKLEIEDAITVIALAITSALKKCNFTSAEQITDTVEAICGFLGALFQKVVPSMAQEARTELIGKILEQVNRLLSRASKPTSSLEEALRFIDDPLRKLLSAFLSGQISSDDAQKMITVIVLATLRNSPITTAAGLEAHVTEFIRAMLEVADECAPQVSKDTKCDLIAKVWASLAPAL